MAEGVDFDPLVEPWIPVPSLAECVDAERPTEEDLGEDEVTIEMLTLAALTKILDILTKIEAKL